jgi:hypothetical protein
MFDDFKRDFVDRLPVAKYWKNGTAMPLSDGIWSAGAYPIAISGNDVSGIFLSR